MMKLFSGTRLDDDQDIGWVSVSSGTGFVSDIAIFVLKRDVKLQLTNSGTGWMMIRMLGG